MCLKGIDPSNPAARTVPSKPRAANCQDASILDHHALDAQIFFNFAFSIHGSKKQPVKRPDHPQPPSRSVKIIGAPASRPGNVISSVLGRLTGRDRPPVSWTLFRSGFHSRVRCIRDMRVGKSISMYFRCEINYLTVSTAQQMWRIYHYNVCQG